MTLKDDILRSRYHIMRLRARGISTKPVSWHEKHIEQLQKTLDKAEAHIKFLENEIRARGTT
jgi:hypothetical protein